MVIKTYLKDFNADLLREQIDSASIPITGARWAGFHSVNDRRYTPNASRVVISRSIVNGVLVVQEADPGELHFTNTVDLTPAQDAALDSVLTNHDFTQRSAEQVRADQDETDIDALLATERQTYLTHLQNWSGYNNTQKMAATEEMFRIVGKVLRVFLRRQRSAAI